LALPKRRHSRARSAKRRANWKIKAPNMVECTHCHAYRLPHQACECGYYNGTQMLAKIEKKESKKVKR